MEFITSMIWPGISHSSMNMLFRSGATWRYMSMYALVELKTSIIKGTVSRYCTCTESHVEWVSLAKITLATKRKRCLLKGRLQWLEKLYDTSRRFWFNNTVDKSWCVCVCVFIVMLFVALFVFKWWVISYYLYSTNIHLSANHVNKRINKLRMKFPAPWVCRRVVTPGGFWSSEGPLNIIIENLK